MWVWVSGVTGVCIVLGIGKKFTPTILQIQAAKPLQVQDPPVVLAVRTRSDVCTTAHVRSSS